MEETKVEPKETGTSTVPSLYLAFMLGSMQGPPMIPMGWSAGVRAETPGSAVPIQAMMAAAHAKEMGPGGMGSMDE